MEGETRRGVAQALALKTNLPYPPLSGGVGGVPLSPGKEGFFNNPLKGEVNPDLLDYSQ